MTRAGLDLIGCREINPDVVQKMDSIDGIPDLMTVGASVGELKVKPSHFEAFPPG